MLLHPMKDVSQEIIDYLVKNKKLRVSYSKNGKYVKYNYDVAAFGDDFVAYPFLNWCRGDVVRRDTFEIISKAPNKFFNLGENDRNTPDKFDWNTIAMITEKKDGFMILPYIDDDEVQFSSRWSYDSPACSLAKGFSTHELEGFIQYHISYGRFPLFELVCEETFIKVSYKPEDYGIKLVNFVDINGNFLNWSNMSLPPCVDYTMFYFHNSMVDIIEFVNSFEKATDFEGVVITFEGGRAVKVKADKYFQFDLSALIRKNCEYILACIDDKTLDDKLPFLPAGIRGEIAGIAAEMIEYRNDLRYTGVKMGQKFAFEFNRNKKDFALFVLLPDNKKYSSLAFQYIKETKNVEEEIASWNKFDKFDMLLDKMTIDYMKSKIKSIDMTEE